MNSEHTQEIWHVETGGQVFETTFAEMTEWIDQGSLLRVDRVRKGNLRWIEAGKVPSLMAVFNAKDNGQPLPPVVTTTKLGPTSMPGNMSDPPASAGGQKFATNPTFGPPANAGGSDTEQPPTADPVCIMHPDAQAAYICTTCFSNFCKACPNSYGGTVKICPYCGAMCESLAKPVAHHEEFVIDHAALGEGFGFSDFAHALAYPFKFKTSLILGALMFMFCSIGQGVAGFGGMFMMFSALMCFLLANTLTFGILANTVDNFAQGRIGGNFMPSFDEFSIWDDVVHPFFLMIGVYISSFGPLIAVAIVAFFMVINSLTGQTNPIQDDAARSVDRGLPYAANAVKQTEQVKALINKQQESQKARIDAIERGEVPESEPPAFAPGANKPAVDQTEASVMRANEMIQQSRKAQLESALGKTPETIAKERQQMVQKILGYGAVFLIIGGICLLWGLFYFPAACAVAGYTRSFWATVNPTVGLDTIRRLGSDYVKILLMGLAVTLMSGFIGGVLGAVLSPFDLPGMGNIPARAISSLFGFYFSVVFSCVIGFALYKASGRLKLPS